MGELGHEVTVVAHTLRDKPPKAVNVQKIHPSKLKTISKKNDITHIHLSYPFIKEAVRNPSSPFLLTHHGCAPWHIVPGASNKIIHLGLLWAYRPLLKKVKVITAVSPYVRDQIRRRYNLESIIIPNGVETSFFRSRNENNLEGSPAIFNATGWNRRKGVDRLIADFSTIKQFYSQAKLYVIVPPGHTQQLKKLLDENRLNIDEDVVPFSYVDRETLSDYFNSADLYLLTSKWESFGLPIIESFASGTPVLAHRVEDARVSLIEESGGGLLYNNTAELLHGVARILDEKSVFSQRAKKYARQFDWMNIVMRYLESYSKVITDES